MEGLGLERSPAGRGGREAAVLAALKSKQKRPGNGGGRQEGTEVGYEPVGHSHQPALEPSPTQKSPLHPLPPTEGGISPSTQQWLNEDYFNQELVRSMTNLDVATLPATSLETSSGMPKRLHVSNIPFYYRDEHLVQLFEQFGDVIEAEIIFHHVGSKGFGFVTMSREEDADMAMASLHWSVVDGRVIDVNLATKKDKTLGGSRFQDLPSMGSTIVWRKSDRPPAVMSYPAVSPLVMVEAQVRLAEAQLAVLLMQQTLLHDQQKEDNTEGSEGVLSDVDSGKYYF